MAYEGAVIASLFDSGPAERACFQLCVDGSRHWRDTAETLTPVDTGRLAAGWEEKPVTRTTALTHPAFEGGVINRVSYGADVNYGTGLWGPSHTEYPIEAKPGKWLSWVTKHAVTTKDGKVIPPGTRVYRKFVMHPGSPGRHMLERSALIVETTAHLWGEPALRAMVREMEAGVRRVRIRA